MATPNHYKEGNLKLPSKTNPDRPGWNKAYLERLKEVFGGEGKELSPIKIPVESAIPYNMTYNEPRRDMYVKMIRAGDTLPPVFAQHPPGNPDIWHIIDGSHRLDAAKKAGIKFIDGYEARPIAANKLKKSEDLPTGGKATEFPNHINQAFNAVRDPRVLTNELRHKQYRGIPNHLAGHCYVASEALWHLINGKETGWVPHCIAHEGSNHWFLKHRATGEILDPTKEQFATPVPYDQARGKGWLTGDRPSKRAQEVMDRAHGLMATGDLEKAEAPNTPEFKNWFGDSKVVDEKNKPSVTYRGSTKNERQLRANGLGLIFVSTDPDEANAFAGSGEGANVSPFYVHSHNPFDPFNEEHLKAIGATPEDNLWHSANVENEDTIAKIKAAGFDGLWNKDGHESPMNLAVFHPHQIKSAIGNSGAFNPQDPDITKDDTAAFRNKDTNEIHETGSTHDIYQLPQGESEEFDPSIFETGFVESGKFLRQTTEPITDVVVSPTEASQLELDPPKPIEPVAKAEDSVDISPLVADLLKKSALAEVERS